MPIPESTDVVVIGGGPAGSTVSALVAQQGYRVQLFERERFPRFHIGESLIPETYWVLKRLGMLPKMQASHFVKKYSVQFVNQHGKVSEPFYFMEHKPHECSQTWQVDRGEFDLMMLDNAREHGALVHEGVRVLEVLFEGDRAVGVRLQGEDGAERDHEKIYFEEVEKCPGIKQRIAGATRVAPFRAAKEYSYRSRQAAGDGWVLAGDAFGFLDPLYSSGVLMALKSGSLAADAIAEGLAKGDTSAARLGKWGPGFMAGMDRMRRLVVEYYDGFSFGRFVK